MTSRSLRVLLVLLALAATAVFGYRALQDERSFSTTVEQLETVQHATDVARTRLADLRAALFAYVGSGQGREFWMGHAGALLESLGTDITAVKDAALGAGLSFDERTVQAHRTLQAAERRARGYVADDQTRLAADVVFTDTRDAFEALRAQFSATGEAARGAVRTNHAVLERQRALAAGGAVLVWALVALILVPIGAPAPAPQTDALAKASPRPLPADPRPPARSPAAAVKVSPMAAPSVPTPSPAPALLTPAPPAVVAASGPDLTATASLCGDLARTTSAEELESLLQRAATLLEANGLIIWLAHASDLMPAASAGYDAALLARVATIPQDGTTLTSAAFRSGTFKSSDADGASRAAFAVPLIGAGGPIGVLSGEAQQAKRIDGTTAGVARIIAAQLVTLVSAMPTTDTTASTHQANA